MVIRKWGATAPPPTYDFVERFEGTEQDSQGVVGFDNANWDGDHIANDPNYAQGAAPLSGLGSLWLQDSAVRDETRDIGPYSDFWFAFIIHPQINETSYKDIISFQNSAGTELFVLEARTDQEEIQAFHGVGQDATSGTDTFPEDETLYVWGHIVQSSGANDGIVSIYVSNTKTRGPVVLSISNGTSTDDFAKVMLEGGCGAIFDDLIITVAELGDDPWANL